MYPLLSCGHLSYGKYVCPDMHTHIVGCCQCLNTYVDNFHSNAKVHSWSMWAMAVGRPT